MNDDKNHPKSAECNVISNFFVTRPLSNRLNIQYVKLKPY